jgi:hypothetical protein
MTTKTISNIAIFEEIAVFIATLVVLYIKVYNVYNISWWALLYPILGMFGLNFIIMTLVLIFLIIGAFNNKNYEVTEKRE